MFQTYNNKSGIVAYENSKIQGRRQLSIKTTELQIMDQTSFEKHSDHMI